MAEVSLHMLLFGGDEKEVIDPSIKIPLLECEIEKMKQNILDHLKSSELNMEELVVESVDLLQEIGILLNKMERSKKQIEHETLCEMTDAIQDYTNISEHLNEVMFSLQIVYQIIECNRLLRNFAEHREGRRCSKAVDVLEQITDLLNSAVVDIPDLEILKTLQTNVVLYWDELLEELSKYWKNSVKWSEVTKKEKRIVTLNVALTTSDSKFSDVLLALDTSKQIKLEMTELGNFILKQILFPLIYESCEVISGDDLQLFYNLRSEEKPVYNDVLANLRIVFQFLYSKLNVKLQSGETLLQMLGALISIDFGNVLVKDCLVDTIPNCVRELQDYGKVTSEVEDFQKFLNNMNFFQSENFSILQYANNVDVLFANKTMQYFLETARDIMKEDLSMTMVVELAELESSDNIYRLHLDEAFNSFYSACPKSPFLFPKCTVSRSTDTLLELVRKMMEQAAQGSELCANRLYYAARQIFEMYIAIVPLHFEEFLKTIPQHVALFHNNCMYLSHHLLTLGERWSRCLNPKEAKYNITFLDQIHKIREVGTKHLTTHMQLEKKTILESINNSDLSQIGLKDSLGEDAERSVRQCLRQLQLLSNVWANVFPPNVYIGLISCLVNEFIGELIHRVRVVEDISAEAAIQLADMFTIVVNKVPLLYQKEDSIDSQVKYWSKLNELILVLGGTLKIIEVRWGSGAGPLAASFQPEELKGLVRALFQNTQARANLLSKIK